jgi:hypothetical protein
MASGELRAKLSRLGELVHLRHGLATPVLRCHLSVYWQEPPSLGSWDLCAHGLCHLETFVGQCAHIVDLVREERHSVPVRRRACGNRESDNLLGWVAIGRNPVLGERDYG